MVNKMVSMVYNIMGANAVFRVCRVDVIDLSIRIETIRGKDHIDLDVDITIDVYGDVKLGICNLQIPLSVSKMDRQDLGDMVTRHIEKYEGCIGKVMYGLGELQYVPRRYISHMEQMGYKEVDVSDRFIEYLDVHAPQGAWRRGRPVEFVAGLDVVTDWCSSGWESIDGDALPAPKWAS